ncbi:MAG: methyltransferase domain-containing protein, partial [Deltaproteobacteria bacterium]|nr:methyltransferase domain-containing protein [Deltaproteobacteria bacterium]
MKTTLGWILTLCVAGCSHQTPGHRPSHNSHKHKHEHGQAQAEGQPQGHKAKTGHHRFSDPERWARVFDKKSRDTWQKPEKVIAKLKLRPNDHVADIGAGTGYFALRLARAVPQGLVYALDIEPRMATYAETRAQKAGLNNVKGGVAGEQD